MPRISLEFDVADEVAEKLIPSVQLYAQLSVYGITIEITNASQAQGSYDGMCEGVNARLKKLDVPA